MLLTNFAISTTDRKPNALRSTGSREICFCQEMLTTQNRENLESSSVPPICLERKILISCGVFTTLALVLGFLIKIGLHITRTIRIILLPNNDETDFLVTGIINHQRPYRRSWLIENSPI